MKKMKYRKKPVIVEAIQFIDNVEVIESILDMSDRKINVIDTRGDYSKPQKNKKYLEIETLEGIMEANIGDYIIKGIRGEVYPCKPGIFEATYEKVKKHKEPVIMKAEQYRRGMEDGWECEDRLPKLTNGMFAVSMVDGVRFYPYMNTVDFAKHFISKGEWIITAIYPCKPDIAKYPLLQPYDACMLYEPLWDINNGKTLCKKCHDKTKTRRNND
jgi:hypothetical protein